MPITATELREWASITAIDPATNAAVDEAVAAANSLVERRCVVGADLRPEVHTATLIQGARFVKRRGSPEGVAGLGDLGAVRISSWDADIEANLSPFLKVTFA